MAEITANTYARANALVAIVREHLPADADVPVRRASLLWRHPVRHVATDQWRETSGPLSW
jgi:hypothetical protein